MSTRTITVAIDNACRLGSMPLIWGAAEGDSRAAALTDAAADMARTDPHTAESAVERVRALSTVAIEWDGPLPDGQDRRAIALALAALSA
jgi:hypothetical protein